jgi:hypothetical protein
MRRLSDLECSALDECLDVLKRQRRVRYQGSKRFHMERLSQRQQKRILELLGRRLHTEGDS